LTEEELRRALDGSRRGVAPGSGGLPYEFYDRLLGDGLGAASCAALNAPFLGRRPAAPGLSPCRLGVISLLFKGTPQKPLPGDDVGSFRPITLLNADYKIAAEAVANRIGAALDAVVDQTQTAFVPGRWIGDNILYHLELLDALSPDAAAPAPTGAPRRRPTAARAAARRPAAPARALSKAAPGPFTRARDARGGGRGAGSARRPRAARRAAPSAAVARLLPESLDDAPAGLGGERRRPRGPLGWRAGLGLHHVPRFPQGL